MNIRRYERYSMILGIVIAIATFLILGDSFQSTYNSTNTLTKEEELKLNEFDDPDKALEFEKLRTRDPNLGYVPRGRLIEAYQNTEQQRVASGTKSNSVMTSNLDWREIGPTGVGGRTRAIMWDPNDPAEFKVWVGSVSGGLWYSDDITYKNDPTWHKIDDFWDNLAISSIDYDPTNTNTYYVSTGEGWGNIDAVYGGGIWKSTNSGYNWEWLSSTWNFGYIQKLKVHPQTGDVYIALAGQGIRRSTDGGENWNEVLGSSTSGNSTSSGKAADIEFAADNTIYVSFGIGTVGEVWKSSTGDEGDWQKLNNGSNGFPNSNIRRVELATAPSDASIVYAMVQDTNGTLKHIYKTNDSGNNWSQVTPTKSNGNLITGGQAWYNMILQVHPEDADTVYAGLVGLFKTNDGGNNWSNVNASPFHADQHMIRWRPNHPDDILFGNDGGVYYSSDGGNSFKNANGNYNVTQFYTLEIDINDASFFLGGTQDNGTQRITNGNFPPASSDKPTGGDGAACFISQSNTNYQITSSQNIWYYLSTDGGQNFSTFIRDTANGGHFINSAEYDQNGDVLYINQTNSSIIRGKNITQNNNRSVDTLKNLNLLGEPSEFAASPYSQHTIFIGTPGNPVGVYKMTSANSNSPSTTEIANGNLGNGWISDIKLGGSENEIVVTKSNYGVTSVYYTSDGGTNWESKEGDLPDIPVRSFLWHETDKTIAYIATEIGVWSTNQFDTDFPDWVPSNKGLANVRTDDISYRDTDQHIVAATHGRGFFEAYLPKTQKQNMNLLSSRYTPSEARGVAVNGSNMFIVDQTNGLQVFDVEDPKDPKLIDEIDLFLHEPEGVDAENGYVYAVANPGNQGRFLAYDVSDPQNVRRTDYIDFPTSKFNDVMVDGDYAYLAAGNNGMYIVSVSNPNNLIRLHSLNTQGKAQSVVVKNNHAFIADGNNGFLIVDVSDHNNPSIVSHTNTSGSVRDLDVQGEYLYVNDYLQGFKIYNIRNLSSPFRVATVTFTNKVYDDVEVSGQFAYLGGYSVRVIDISDPSNPTDAGYYNGPYRATDIATNGKYVHASLTKGLHVYSNDLVGSGTNWNTTYVGNGNQPTDARDIEVVGNYGLVANGRVDNLSILDITNPQIITEISSVPLHDEAVKVKQRGNYAYVMVEQDGLSIIDISDIKNPIEISEVDVSDEYYADRLDVTFYDYFAFLSVDDDIDGGIFVVDLSDKANPVEVDHFFQNYETHSAKVYDGMLHIGAGNDGYHIFDISKVPNSYTRIDSIDAGYKIVDVKVKGDYAFAAAENSGLVVFDISTMSDIKVVGYYPIHQDVYNVELDKYYAYVASEYEGVTILNIMDPNNPYLVGYYDTSTEMFDFDLVNGKVYAAIGEAGVIAVNNDLNPYGDIHNFNNIACVETNGGAVDVDVPGNYAYVADGTAGMTVIDVTNPSNAQKVGNVNLEGFTQDLEQWGSYVYSANSHAGMKVIDISSPTVPQEVASYSSSGFTRAIDVLNGVAALASSFEGAEFIDISDPLNPTYTSDWKTLNSIKDVQLHSDYAFISDGDITVVDLSTLANPSRVAQITTPGESGKIVYDQGYLYVADGRKGVTVIEAQNPQNLSILNTFDVGGYVTDVSASGRYVYASSDESGLTAIDFIIKSKPKVVAYTQSEGAANGVYNIAGNIYLANGSKGLCIYENQHSTPSEYDIDPSGFVFEVAAPEVSITQPVLIINNTNNVFDFLFDIGGGIVDTTGTIVGEWLLTTDYYCDENIENQEVINFFSDNTFTTNMGNSGGYTLNGNQIEIFFNSGAEYSGTVNPNYTSMEGAFVGPEGVAGCWNANFLNPKMSKTIEVSKGARDAAGLPQKKQKLRHTVTDAGDWLTIEPQEGVIEANSKFETKFSIDTSGLEPGYYAAEVEFDNPFENYLMKVELYLDDESALTVAHELSSEWNLISLPLSLDENAVDSVFPGKSETIYGFSGKYFTPESFRNGKGYWIKPAVDQTFTISGNEIEGSAPVQEGWNIIGPFNESVEVSAITTEPAGILIGNFYGFNNGYNIVETLNPWSGYWVQSTEDGFIQFNRAAKSSKSEDNIRTQDRENWITLNVTDKTGKSMTLYFADQNIDPREYELPPMAPLNVFDVRFGDDTYATKINDASKELRVNNAVLPYRVSVTDGDLRIVDNLGGDKVNKIVRDGESITINKKSLNSLSVSAVEVPIDFTLMQNYPNPFNPATTIKFGLPNESKVDIVIYDVLGRRVETIVSKKFEAGYHEVEFDGSRFASGVYIYRMDTDNFNDVKKMVLVK